MKISEIENRAYQWIGKDGGWQVGKPLLVDGDIVILPMYFDGTYIGEKVVMQPLPTGEATWVALINLQPYPSKPIEEPKVKAGE